MLNFIYLFHLIACFYLVIIWSLGIFLLHIRVFILLPLLKVRSSLVRGNIYSSEVGELLYDHYCSYLRSLLCSLWCHMGHSSIVPWTEMSERQMVPSGLLDMILAVAEIHGHSSLPNLISALTIISHR